MDSNLKSNFSFPNSDQSIPGASGEYIPKQEGDLPERKKTINIMDALAGDKNDRSDAQTVRTYQSDIANTIKNDNVSMIKVALSEKKRQEKRGSLDNTLEESNKNLYIVIGSIIAFIVIGGLVGGYIFLQSQRAQKATEVQQQKVQPLIYTEINSTLNIDEINVSDLFRLIEKDKEALLELGDMKSIILTTGTSTTERQLTTSEFFNVISSRAPEGLVRSFNPNFTLGVYAFNPREMFAVFKIDSYDAAFAGMLEWEPSIESDIGDIFINKRDVVNTDLNSLSTTSQAQITEVSSTTSTTTAPNTQTSSPFGVLSQRKFVDKIIENKDIRVLVDSNRKESMLYTFIDKETLIIATSPKSLKEIIFRLTTGRIAR